MTFSFFERKNRKFGVFLHAPLRNRSSLVFSSVGLLQYISFYLRVIAARTLHTIYEWRIAIMCVENWCCERSVFAVTLLSTLFLSVTKPHFLRYSCVKCRLTIRTYTAWEVEVESRSICEAISIYAMPRITITTWAKVVNWFLHLCRSPCT